MKKKGKTRAAYESKYYAQSGRLWGNNKAQMYASFRVSMFSCMSNLAIMGLVLIETLLCRTLCKLANQSHLAVTDMYTHDKNKDAAGRITRCMQPRIYRSSCLVA